MTDIIDSRALAAELAETYDVDPDHALEAVNLHLEQLSEIDGVPVDEISADESGTIREAFWAAMSSSHVDALDDLADVRAKIDDLADLQAERASLVRKALRDGARVADIANASGLTRGRIYQIRDGR